MSQSFMSPLQTFTLESLVALEQWSAIQASNRRKSGASRTKAVFSKENSERELKVKKTEL